MSLASSFNAWSIRSLIKLFRFRSITSVSASSGTGSGQPTRSSLVMFPRNRGYSKEHSSAALGMRLFKTRSAGAAGPGEEDEAPSPPTTPTKPSRPPTPGLPIWTGWILGSVLSLVLSYWMPKWGTLLKIGGEAEIVMQEVEKAAEAVEKVATIAEKVSTDIAGQLPDDAKFKEAAVVAEHVSEEAANDARVVEEIIHKVDAVKQEVEEIEKLAETVIHKIIREEQKPSNL